MESQQEIRDRVIEALQTIYDPEIPVNIYELGLIYKVEVDEDGSTRIEMTLTSPACPGRRPSRRAPSTARLC